MTEQEFQKEIKEVINITKGDLIDVVCAIIGTRDGVGVEDVDLLRAEIYHYVTDVLKMLNSKQLEKTIESIYLC